MNQKSFTAGFHILRVGLAVTFIWIGVLILKSPESWGGYLQPWAVNLLPISIKQALAAVAFFDIIVGTLFLVDLLVWIAAVAAALHLVAVLTVSGITDITVRDIGLLAGALALLVESLPDYLKSALKKFKIDL